MSVRESVQQELAGQTGWKVEMALALASEIDEKGTASAAKELRSLLSELGAADSGAAEKETGLSEFERRLAEREAKTARRSRGA